MNLYCRCPRNYFVSVALIYMATLATTCQGSWPIASVNYEEAPINYRTTPPENAITRLQSQIDNGQISLDYDTKLGYLPALLNALDISPTSQVMPFAKVSRQNPKISPETPRAIYFNDSVHLGYVQQGLIEVAVTDPKLGMVFYTLEQDQVDKPKFANQSASCLTCHGTAKTRNVPGLQVRSVIPDLKGEPVLAAGSYRSDHSSPFEKRWGGWYVTGKHGDEKHIGNLRLLDSKKPKQIDNSAGQNVTTLERFFDTSKYLTPHSDLIALMVLEHQADAINFMTIANFETRLALYQLEQQIQKQEGDATAARDAANTKIAKAGDSLVKYLLFHNELKLKTPLEGTSGFAEQFGKSGPYDKSGRSLRHFDLNQRLFKYPLSYTIYSDAFASLPDEMRRYVHGKLYEVLSSEQNVGTYTQMDKETRTAVLQILSDTLPDFHTYASTSAL